MAVGGQPLAAIGEEEDTATLLCTWCEDVYRRAKILPCIHTFRLPSPVLLAEPGDPQGRQVAAPSNAPDSSSFGQVTESPTSADRQPRVFFCALCQEMTRQVCQVCEISEAKVAKFQTRFFLDIVVARQRSPAPGCGGQGCSASAAFACCDCQLTLCLDCRRSHDASAAKTDHLLLRFGRQTRQDKADDSVVEGFQRLSAQEAAPSKCPVHAENGMTLYCRQCRQLACPLCQEEERNPHEDHDVVSVDVAAEAGRARASELLNELNAALKAQVEDLEEMEKAEQGLARRRQYYLDEGANVVSRITTSLHAAIGKMTRRVNELEDSVLSQLHSKKTAVRLRQSTLVRLQQQLIQAVSSAASHKVLSVVPVLETKTHDYLAGQSEGKADEGSRADLVAQYEAELRTQLRTLEQALETITALFFYDAGQKQSKHVRILAPRES